LADVDEIQQDVGNRLASFQENPLFAVLRGYIFLSYVIELLENGGTFQVPRVGK
jgi:hypothetical protein